MNIIKLHINGKDIYHAFVSGAKKIINDKLILNRINVFPVPDGDTGTNLAYTMDHIIHSAKCEESVDQTVNSIYSASIKGARGNSGMIFTGFLSGLNNYVKGRNMLSMNEFSDALFQSVDNAYASVSIPVEGTMLTVFKDWALSIQRNLPKVYHFGELIEKSLQDAKDSLIATKEKLDVLKKANVVDSGGKGVVDFIEGMVDFFMTGKESEYIEDLKDDYQKINSENDISERYCIEVYLIGADLDLAKIKMDVGSMGSSLIIAGDKKEVKVHVHTNKPDEVVGYVAKMGELKSHKIDDMKKQAESENNKYNIALVTDSIADISQDILDRYQIHVIPLSLFIDGIEYFDKLSLKPEAFYDMVDKSNEFPTSSQPPVSKFNEIFSKLSNTFDSIIGFFVSSKLSGTYQNASIAAEKLKTSGYKIDIIDSKLNSGAQGLVLMKLAEMIHIGKTHDEVRIQAKNLIKRTKIYVSVLEFEYMVRGGRVSPLKGIIAKILNLKPIVSLDEEGSGIAFDKSFSVKSIEKKIIRLIKKAHEENHIIVYSLVYSLDRRRAEHMAENIEQVVGIKPAFITEISSVVGISAGKGAVAVSFITEERM